MVTAAGAVSGVRAVTAAGKLGGKGKGLNGVLMGIFSIPEFSKVPSAFKLSYNRSAQKVTGLNWTSGILETVKSIPKAAQYFIIPAILTGVAVGAAPAAATIATLAGLGIPMGLSNLFEHILPHEEEVIELACKEKGIDITKPDGMPNINNPEGYLA